MHLNPPGSSITMRVKWQFMLKSAWAVALVAGGVNIAVLAFI